MKYSIDNFTVKPGQYVRITLKNPDEMQHNLVFVRPGSVEEVGELVTAMAKATDAADRDYIPPTPDVLVWTKLVDPGQIGDARIHRADHAGRLSLHVHVPGPLEEPCRA